VRTGLGAGFLAWVGMIFMAGSADRALVFLDVSYVSQLWFYRVAVWIVPVLVRLMAWRLCLALQAAERVEADREAAEEEAASAAEAGAKESKRPPATTPAA
jgi:hypothetical protein